MTESLGVGKAQLSRVMGNIPEIVILNKRDLIEKDTLCR